jgi:hypothetical protein
MAQKLSSQTYYEAFAAGQGDGIASYYGYASHLDANFQAIRASVDAIVDEVKAIGGADAALLFDLVMSESISTGTLGVHSFAAAITGGGASLTIQPGAAYTHLGRIELTAQQVLAGSGTTGTRYVALRSSGDVTLETATAQGVMDLWSCAWDGSVFTGTPTRLAEILVDADDLQGCRTAEGGSGAGLPAKTYLSIANRLTDLDRLVRAVATGVEGDTLGRIAVGGSVGTPGLILGDGTTFDTTSGLYRPSANVLAVSILATEAVRFAESVTDAPQALFRQGTDATAPPWAFVGDPDTGALRSTADAWDAIAGGRVAARFRELSNLAQFLVTADGSASQPNLARIGDEDTGLLFDVADEIAAVVGGTEAERTNAQGQRSSATQGRCAAYAVTFSVANNTITAVNLTAERHDVGGYHDNATNPDRITVPTGHGGHFSLRGHVVFDESTSGGTPNAGDRGVEITINGTVAAQARVPAVGAGDTALAVAVSRDLVATDIVRITAFQDSGGSMNVAAELSVTHDT